MPIKKYTDKRMFLCQKSMAKRRGIPFDITFDEWLKWWIYKLGNEWRRLRGRKKDQYVMARKGDIGIYCIENVECRLAQENTGIDRANNGSVNRMCGETNPTHKLLNDDVINIFLSNESGIVLARRFGVTASVVSKIKNRKVWKHVTEKL